MKVTDDTADDGDDAEDVAIADSDDDNDADSDYVQPNHDIVDEIEELDDDDDSHCRSRSSIECILGACERFKISDFNVPRIVSCDVTRRKARNYRWAVTKALRDLGITGVRGGKRHWHWQRYTIT